MTHDDSSRPDGDRTDDESSVDDEATVEITSPEADPEATESEADDTASDDTASDDTASDDTGDAGDADDETVVIDTADHEITEDEVAEDQTDEDEIDDDEPSSRRPLASMALAAAVAALIGAVLCIAYFGYTGIRAYTVDAAATTLRTESVDAAEQAVLNITAVDPKNTADWKKRLESSLTGDALTQVNTGDFAKLAAQVEASGGNVGKIDSRIARSAVTELSTDDDTATVLVFTNVTAGQGQQAQQSQMGFLLTIVDVDGTRKASKVVPLNPIEYSEAGSDVSTVPGSQPETTAPAQGGN